jgi:hypothetical protein
VGGNGRGAGVTAPEKYIKRDGVAYFIQNGRVMVANHYDMGDVIDWENSIDLFDIDDFTGMHLDTPNRRGSSLLKWSRTVSEVLGEPINF